MAVVLVAVPTLVFGAGEGGRVPLDLPIRTKDTRVGGDGSRVTSTVVGDGVLQVWALSPAGPGSAVLHPCTSPPPADEATFLFSGDGDVHSARFATAESVCLSSSAAVHVVVDRSGSVTTTPDPARSQHVPLSAPVPLWDARIATAEQVLVLGRPPALSTDATAAVISIESIAADGIGYLAASACDGPRPLTADVSYTSFGRHANVAYVALDADDELCVFVRTPTQVRVELLGELSRSGPDPASLPPAWRYVPGEVPPPSLRPFVPVRVLDTRDGVGRPGTSKVAPNEVVEIELGELVGPRTTAVVLNVTVDQPESAGFVTAWPCGGDRPVASNLNFVRSETVPNLVVSKLGPGGTVCLSGISRTHLIADLNGTFEADGGLMAVPISPQRILDTREPVGVPTVAKLGAGEVLALQVTGGRVPATAGAATVNVTVTEPDAAGFVTAYPCDQGRPEASNLNYVPGQTVANLVTSKLSADGRLCLFSLARTHLVADIAAWYGVDQPAGLIELPPERFLDTREAIGIATTSKVPAGGFVQLQVAGRGGVAADADSVVMNLTATEPEGYGFLTAWPCDRSMPTVSNVNYAPFETNPNLATVTLSAAGTVCIYTMATSHIIADVAGYLTEAPIDGQALTLR